MTDKKFSLGEAAAVLLIGGPLGIAVMLIVLIPFGLLLAWMRSLIWSWFAVPYLHAPRIGVWLMFIIGIFVSSFFPAQPEFKDDVLKCKGWHSMVFAFIAQVVAFLTAWGIKIKFLEEAEVPRLEAEILRLRKNTLTQTPERVDNSVVKAKSTADVRRLTEAAFGRELLNQREEVHGE